MSSEIESIIKLDASTGSMATSFEAKPKKWGNSLGIVLPADIVRDNKIDTKHTIAVRIMPKDNSNILSLIGTMKRGLKSTQEELDEIDEEERLAEERRYRRHLRNR